MTDAKHPGRGSAPVDDQNAAGTRDRGPSPRLSRGIAAVLGLLAVVAAVAIVLQLVLVRPAYQETTDRREARAQAVRVAEQFAVRINNYDDASIEDYQATIAPLLTTKFRGEFDKTMEDIVTSVQEAEMSSQGTVLTSGVASVDTDSAEVLVVSDANVATVFDTRARHFRWEVSLVRVDGDWLVDNFNPVA